MCMSIFIVGTDARAVLSPVMTSLSERLRVQYGDAEEPVRASSSSASDRLGGKNAQQHHYRSSSRGKLFQNRSNVTLKEGHVSGHVSSFTDSGIHSSVDISEIPVGGATTGDVERSAGSPVRSKPLRKTSNSNTVKPFSRSSSENVSSSLSHVFSSQISRDDTENFKLPPSRFTPNAPRRLTPVSPARSEIMSPVSRRDRPGSRLSLQPLLDRTGNYTENRRAALPVKVNLSVPAKQASVCAGKGKCNKPVCFVCIA